jgi:hypothetical protein
MYALRMKTIILQYLELRVDEGAVTKEAFLAAGDRDPVGWNSDYADGAEHEMDVFVGLRLDKRLEGSVFLNDPKSLFRQHDHEDDGAGEAGPEQGQPIRGPHTRRHASCQGACSRRRRVSSHHSRVGQRP